MVIHALELILCRVVESSCLSTHNVVRHISWHDPPCHMTTKKYSEFPSMVIFHLLLRKFWIQTRFCNCPQYLCLFHIVFEYTTSFHDQGKMLVLPKSTSSLSTFHIGSMFCFFPANFMSQIRIILFHRVRISIPNWKPSPNHASTGFSQIAFPIRVLPKDDLTDLAQEERLGLPYWTMI